ncbi:MAG: hypothetical protein ACE5HK_01755 [Candidatus Methylomirabilales bacterium]
MDSILSWHRLFGERILPILLLCGVLWLILTWKPGALRPVLARVMAVLIDLQVALGLIVFLYGVMVRYLNPLNARVWLHLGLAILSAGAGHVAAKNPPALARLGRWSPLVGFGGALVLLLMTLVVGKFV